MPDARRSELSSVLASIKVNYHKDCIVFTVIKFTDLWARCCRWVYRSADEFVAIAGFGVHAYPEQPVVSAKLKITKI